MKTKLKIFGCALSLLIFRQISTAQPVDFKGGIGKGDIMQTSGAVNLNGSAYSLAYVGGGGRGDGVASSAASMLNGTAFVSYYSGGAGRGDALAKTDFQVLNGVETELKFRGGSGDGDVLGIGTASLLNGIPFETLFPGGTRSGDASAKVQAVQLNGTSFVMLFSGGAGRGDFKRISTSLLLNGATAGVARINVKSLEIALEQSHGEQSLRCRDAYHFLENGFRIQLEMSKNGSDFYPADYGFTSQESDLLIGGLADIEPGIYRFRLHAVNSDAHLYSNTESVTISPDNHLLVSPNPTSGDLKIGMPGNEKISRITVFDFQNRLVYSATGSELGSTLNLAGLQSGIYWLEVNQARRVRFIKQ